MMKLTFLDGLPFTLVASCAAAATCELLRSASLPHVTITSAEVVAPAATDGGGRAGGPAQTGAALPEHCRVTAVTG